MRNVLHLTTGDPGDQVDAYTARAPGPLHLIEEGCSDVFFCNKMPECEKCSTERQTGKMSQAREELEGLRDEHEKMSDHLNGFHADFYDALDKLHSDILDKIAAHDGFTPLAELESIDASLKKLVEAKNGFIDCLKRQTELKCQMVELDTSLVLWERAEKLKAKPNDQIITQGAE